MDAPTCFRCGDFDERPVHRVTITKRFRMAECQVTNAQYEMFDPAHASGNGTAHYVFYPPRVTVCNRGAKAA